MKWINVKDKLPSEYLPVMLYINGVPHEVYRVGCEWHFIGIHKMMFTESTSWSPKPPKQCNHENEIMRQGDGFTYSECGDCGEELT